ncbi:hypothetical protein FA15DRAFT_675991 [Coprinopsis marcescibilis]|uniref:RING-type domain-containing protein n=1 Tax=Coprinopsis marcescibilis TaxID=230819 RepID=A0A5C3KBU7_COPMA|nr:hypothetical protein FA15DRAFT_675991 [Coprinopsis marcescibilis]
MNTKTPVNSDAETTRINEKDVAKASYHQRLLADPRPISVKQRTEGDVRRVAPIGPQAPTLNTHRFSVDDKPRHYLDIYSPFEPRYHKRPTPHSTAIALPEQHQSTNALATFSMPTSAHVPQRHQPLSVMGSGRTKKENLRAPALLEQRSRNSLPVRGISVLDLGRKEAEGLPSLPFDTDRGSQLGWESMQHELELLRKAVQEMHKTTRKQTKKIEELKNSLSSNAQLLRDRENEVAELKLKYIKSENLISTIESSVQCQICMELPLRPFSLAPCGHVLCLTCLQEWFRTSTTHDEDDEDPPETNVLRPKTCPCCRSLVRHRPSPVFMVKAVSSALIKEKEIAAGPSASGERSDGIPDLGEEDPWRGIFPSSDDDGESDEDLGGDSSDDLEDGEVDDWMIALDASGNPHFSWSSESEDEDEDNYPLGRYAQYDDTTSEEEEVDLSVRFNLPRWEPASVNINPDDYDFDGFDDETRENTLALLRRGCSWEMIQNFNMEYAHLRGIIVCLRSINHLYLSDDDDSTDEEVADGERLHRVYLGFNIILEEDDRDGEAYIHSVLDDIRNHPERWRKTRLNDGRRSMEVRRLVPFYGFERGNTTTDDEIWSDSEEGDGDEDDGGDVDLDLG